jgi:hypothetical protein
MRFIRNFFAALFVAISAPFAEFCNALARLTAAHGGQLLLINPRKRRRGRRKMSALQRKYFGGGRKKRRRGGKKARRASSRRRRNPIRVLNLGPRRRRRKGRAAVHRIRRRGRARYRRNPISLRGLSGGGGSLRASMPSIVGFVKGAAVGAVGAIAVDVIMGQAGKYLPNAMKTPNAYPAVKAVAAIVLGIAGRRVPVIGKFAVKMAEGSLICTARDFMRGMVPASWTLGDGELGYYSPGFMPPASNLQNLLGTDSGMGRYVDMAGDQDDSNSPSEMAGTGMYVGT